MDIALDMISPEPGQPPAFDIALDGLNLATDAGLRTAVILSLFTDRRAEAYDVLPDASGDRRGWWADAYADDRIGSRLWLLAREKQQPQVLARAREYAEQALRWMVDDGLATRVSVTAETVRTGVLGLRIVITLADGSRFEQETSYAL